MRVTALLVTALLVTPAAVRAQDAGVPEAAPDLDALLRTVVHPDGVDYAALRARLPALVAAHRWFATHGPTATPARFANARARQAYWLNAYNLTVLRGVAEAPATMRNVLTWLPGGGFFRQRRWPLDGRTLTLDEVEHRELRAAFRDARVHFALSCAARSCPPLRAEAFDPARLDAQLDAQARGYLNSPGAVRLDPARRVVTAVQLFAWFAEDFAAPIPGRARAPFAGALGFIGAFADPPLRARLDATCGDGRCTLAAEPYDWSLNDRR